MGGVQVQHEAGEQRKEQMLTSSVISAVWPSPSSPVLKCVEYWPVRVARARMQVRNLIFERRSGLHVLHLEVILSDEVST